MTDQNPTLKIKEEPYFDECAAIAAVKAEPLELTCGTCEALFVDEHELRVHNMIHSDDHTCFVCKEFVKNRFQFVGHVRKHMGRRPFRCPSCERTFPTWRETKLHLRVHSDNRPFMCTECGKAFKQIATLKDHEVVHTGEKRFKCKICEGAFATATSLRRHIRVMHETLRSFKCHFCSEQFSSREALNYHMAAHKDRPFKCQLCEETMENLEDYTSHRDTRHFQKKTSGLCAYCANQTFYFNLKDHVEKMHSPRNCEICDLVFYDDKSMENHKKNHSEDSMKKELNCDVCGKSFEFPRYLKAHVKRHGDNYKRFKCDICSKTFSSKRDLNNHLNVHADVKDYSCNICGKAFRTKQSVNKHLPVHSDKRPFRCNLCDKRFKKQSILRKHALTHSISRPFLCDLCPKNYKSKESLRVHKLSHSFYTCKTCKQTFTVKDLYHTHYCPKRMANRPRLKCRVCRRQCNSSITLAYHTLRHSKQLPFRCKTCGERVRYRYRLILHEISHKSVIKSEVD